MESAQRDRLFLGAAILIFTLTVFLSAWSKLSALRMDGMDLAIIFQAVWQTAHGQFFASSIHPPSYLGDHFTPLLLFFVPLVRLWPSPVPLILAQALALGLAAWPAWLLARQWLSPRAAFWSALAFLVNPLLWNAGLYEFHSEAFVPLFGLGSAYFFVQRRWRGFVCLSVLVLLVREDAAFFVIMLGVIALLERRPWQWWALVLVVPAAWFAGSIALIHRSNADGTYKYSVYYQWLGSDPMHMLEYAARHPLEVLGHFFLLGNVEMTVGMLLPFLFLPLLGRRFLLLLALPWLQFALTTSGGGGLVVATHYGLLFVPGLAVSALYGLRQLSRMQLPVWLAIFRQEKLLLRLIAAVWVGCVFFTLGPARALVDRSADSATLPPDVARPLLSAIPAGAGVATTYGFLPLLADRSMLVNWHYAVLGRQQFGRASYDLPKNVTAIFLDTQEFLTYALQADGKPADQQALHAAPARLRQLLADRGFTPCMSRDTLVLFLQHCREPLELYRLTRLTEPLASRNDTLYFYVADAQANVERVDGGGLLHIRLRVVPKQPSPQPVAMQVVVRDTAGNSVYQRDFPLGYGLYPTTDWQQGREVMLWYDVWLPREVVSAATARSAVHFFMQEGEAVLGASGSIERRIERNYLSAPLEL